MSRRDGPPTRRRRPGQGAPSDSATTTRHLVPADGTPHLGSWTSTTRYQLRAGRDGTLRARDLPHLRVALPGDTVRLELRGGVDFTGDAAAIVGRAVAAASVVEVYGGRPGIAAAFRDLARDAARNYVRSLGGAA